MRHFVVTLYFCFTALVLAKVPLERLEKAYASNEWHAFDFLTTDATEYWQNGKLVASGKTAINNVVNFQSSLIPKFESIIHSIRVKGNLATVHRRTSLLGKAGCFTTFDGLDIYTFSDSGQALKIEFFGDKSLDEIVAEISCSPIFSPEVVKQKIQENLFFGKPFAWTRDALSPIFTDDVEITLPNGAAFSSLEDYFRHVVDTKPFKWMNMEAKEIFVTGNTAHVIGVGSGLTPDNCLWTNEEIIRIELSYPDGKIKKYESITTIHATIDRCGGVPGKVEL